MKVKMLVTKLGAPDGIHVEEFKAGEVYDHPPSLSEPWIEAKVCKPAAKPAPAKDKATAPHKD
jgi:hypothetical protein